MNRDRAIGVGLVAVGAIGILLYGWLVFFSPWRTFMLQLTAYVAVAVVLGILAWMRSSHHTPAETVRRDIEKEVQKALEEIEKPPMHNITPNHWRYLEDAPTTIAGLIPRD